MVPRDIEYLRRLYRLNQEAVQNYYLSRSFAVKNTHIISRLLEHIPVHLSYEDYRYLDSVSGKLTYLGRHFLFTSDIEAGAVHPPYFFANSGEEFIFAGQDDFDVYRAQSGWRTMSAVRVLMHPRSDDRMLLATGVDDGGQGGLASVYVDLGVLAYQWRQFQREQTLAEATGEGMVLSKNHFVARHVLPGMLKDIIDHTLLNKLMAMFYAEETIHPKRKYPFRVFTPTTQVNRYLEETLERIQSKKMDFVAILRHIKLVFSDSAADLLALPGFGGTRQIKPAVLATRIRYMAFLLDVSKDLSASRHHVNDFKRFVSRIKTDNNLESGLSYEIWQGVQEKIARIEAA